ncbi:TetR/AcrR family transcriptional regulator [Mycobacterium avium subsp. paratuberculosis]|uniref:HTH tetR-type domain-containing protein n=1 Tax=Mycolicibacterium paratuberculosis (strain ATCC BAA-968 / K-10) TaxID=262316 RepID=Q73UM5_MYCPA|nr:hypothetical protein MAP_3341 [Mycobacterium avium subsp. paratuberculosis K-10]AVJ54068.1 TetR/AcrR family transcriptional regulator [Mycobacterium avium subsp. paratuberculosis]ELP44991.1 hypothetical protein D522_19241 [Mycobacterium avium subsp. paratuberculosis S5]AYQ67799.1 TetR/AcrR family transcriptional regulator [Mycobacterium avium subsp. paratuberculosis]AYQ78783.1 TetR/AcrR family transcriptional regulator [Mycobacterium avium subsp. paratuberculosis]
MTIVSEMPYGASMQSPATPSARGGGIREARRRETRARLFDAALAEISQRGLAAADVSAIVADAGVARGTFYFHFPTKEHVLVEVERAEETRIVSELGGATGDLAAVLNQLVQHVLSAEKPWAQRFSGTCSDCTSARRGRSKTSWRSTRSDSSWWASSAGPRTPGRSPPTLTRPNSRRSSSPGCSRCWPPAHTTVRC